MEREIDFGQFQRAEREASPLPWAVYRALDAETGRDVRLAVLWGPGSLTPERRRASLDWFAEAGYQSQRLTNPALAPVVSYRSVADAAWVATAAPSGSTVHELLSADGPMPIERAMHVSSLVARALAAAHEAGWAHGFLNAETVWVDGDLVLVSDLGLAIAAREMHSNASPYATTAGLLASDPRRRDMQCLGLLVTEMLTGSLPDPVGIPRPEVFPDSVPPPAVKKIRALINPQSVDAMTAAEWAEYAHSGESVEEEVEESAIAAPDVHFYDSPSRREIPWAWIATAMGFILLATAVIVLWFRQAPSNTPTAIAQPAAPPFSRATVPMSEVVPVVPPTALPPEVLTHVQVGPIQPADEDKTTAKLTAMGFQPYRKPEGSVVYMQVGAFANADGAKATVDLLQRAGFAVRVK